MVQYNFAISDDIRNDMFGRNVRKLVYNPSGRAPLCDRHLPKYLFRQMLELGWMEDMEAYCSRVDDGKTKEQLIAEIEAMIPNMRYKANLEPYLKDER